MMSFKPITVNTPATDPAHILAQDDAILYHGIIGQDCVLDIGSKMEAIIIDNNTVRILDGAVMVQGHLGHIPHGQYEDLHIENGVAGQKRHDLIVARFETTAGIDTYELAVIKGVPGIEGRDPDVTTGNLSAGDMLREYPLYRVKVDGLSLASIENMYTVGSTIGLLNQSLNSHISDFESLIAGGQSFTAVLEKGWTGNLYYSKNDLDLAHIRGELIAGEVSPVSQIAVLPIAYIPKQNQALGMIVVGQSVYTGAVINQYSQIQIRKPASENIQTGDKIQINMIYQA